MGKQNRQLYNACSKALAICEAAAPYYTKERGVDSDAEVEAEEAQRIAASSHLSGEHFHNERLAKLGIKHKVIHTSVEEGDGKGYDIVSIEDDGVTPRYIEVKTTTGGIG